MTRWAGSSRVAGLLVLALASLGAVSTGEEELSTEGACHFLGGWQRGKVATRAPDPEAERMVQWVVDAVGLRPRFELRAARVRGASASIRGERRFILYSPRFIRDLARRVDTDWAGVSVLAHEIGHHLNGHTLTRGAKRHPNELEADEFSGFVLARLGASLPEAQAAMRVVGSPRGSRSHPPRDQRLEAIARGWHRARAEGALLAPADLRLAEH